MIDISVTLKNGMDVWEGDPPFDQSFILTAEKDGLNVSKLTLSAHSGTHVDAPLHFVANGKGISELDLNTLIGNCQVISIPDSKLVDRRTIPASALPESFKYPRIILKTSNATGKFSRDSVALSLEAAQYLVDKEIKLIGINGLSIESYYGNGDVHRCLLGAQIIILETIDLTHVEEGYYHLTCLPAKIEGCDGAPARAILTPPV